MSFKFVLVTMLSLALLLAGEELQGNKGIINGDPAAEGEIKYQVALMKAVFNEKEKLDWVLVCGGSIISQDAILTAAHCFRSDKNDPLQFKVRYGTIDREDNTTEGYVGEIFRHPEYNKETFEFDIAVLKLRQKIKFSKNVDLVALDTELPTVTDNLIISGWGREKNRKSPRYLMKAETLKLVTQPDCQKAWGKVIITNNMLCAMSGQQSVCTGDSGGPLINKKTGKQIGVSALFTSGCNVGVFPNGFTSVPQLHAWIKEKIA